jgi:hypothetical protein
MKAKKRVYITILDKTYIKVGNLLILTKNINPKHL